jgi:hypothetical protein
VLHIVVGCYWVVIDVDVNVDVDGLLFDLPYPVKNDHVISLLSQLVTVCSVVSTVNSQEKTIKSHTKPIKIQIFLSYY